MAGISRPVVHVGIVAGLVLFLGLAVVNASQPDGTHPGWIGSAVVVGLGLLGYLVVVRPWEAWRRPDDAAALEQRGRDTDHLSEEHEP